MHNSMLGWRDSILKGNPFVATITGGGTGFFSEMLRHGGASRVFLNGMIPYDQRAFEHLIGFAPKKFADESAAFFLAEAAQKIFATAAFETFGDTPAFSSLGVAASLGKLEQRVDRFEKVSMCIIHPNEISTCTLPFDIFHDLERSVQEDILVECIFAFLANDYDFLRAKKALMKVRLNTSNALRFWRKQQKFYGHPMGRTIFPGSFNPIQDGHKKLIEFAREYTGDICELEISCENWDKGRISLTDALERRGILQEQNYPVILTNAATFIEKFNLFRAICKPGKKLTFVMGFDTLERLTYDIQQKGTMVHHEEMFAECQFIVGGRPIQGQWMDPHYLVQGRIPEQYRNNFVCVPKERCNVDISSTQIRNSQ